jgi:RNA polymerase sigma factor (sigma-70 family)
MDGNLDLDAAYSLARWLARNDHDAEDVVQMAFVRAFKFFESFRGGNARAWLLTIVRRTYYTWLRDHRHEDDDVGFDEALHSGYEAGAGDSPFEAGNNPESIAASHDTQRIVNQALEKLPRAYREIVVLKDIENLSYKEIAEVAEIPIGTVMSRLARGRKLLSEDLQRCGVGESNGL